MRKILYVSGGLILLALIIFFIPERKKEIEYQHFKFYFSSDIDTDEVSTLAKTLEDSYQRISNDLKTMPSSSIDVNIYSQRWRYIQATKNWGASGSIEGASKLHFVENAWGEPEIGKVAVHEFAHTVTLKLLLDNEPQPVNSKDFDLKFLKFPMWLWEGVSVYEAQQLVDPKTLPYLADGHYPDIAELNSRMKGGKIYSCGYTIIEYILTKYGQEKLILLIKDYGNLQRTLGVSDDQFCQGWYQFIKEKYLIQ